MKLIRLNTFETNSSSCHSITVFKTSDFIKFKNGETFYIGDYEYHDDHNTYYNELKSEDFLTIEDIKDRVIEYLSYESNLRNLRDHDSESGWGNTYRAAEFLVKTNPDIDFYKKVMLEDDEKVTISKLNYNPTIFDSELKRTHYGFEKSNLSLPDYIVQTFVESIDSYIADFITDTVLQCQSGVTSFYLMFQSDACLVCEPIEIGDQTIARTYISC